METFVGITCVDCGELEMLLFESALFVDTVGDGRLRPSGPPFVPGSKLTFFCIGFICGGFK